MSAKGQKQTFALQQVMSALPPIADICGATRHVRFVPIADIKEVGVTKENPGTLPGALSRNIVSQNPRLELCPMSVGSVVIVARTAIIVGTTTIKLVVGRTITTITVARIRSRTIGVAVISRTIIVRP